MIDVVRTVFGDLERRAFMDFPQGSIHAYIQDVRYPDWLLCYTSNAVDNPNYPKGDQSVYQSRDGYLWVEAEKDILTNTYGEPINIVGVQRYFPQLKFGPTQLDPGDLSWYQTIATYGFCLGNCNPAQPDVNSPVLRYEVAVHTDGAQLWVDEDYFENGIKLYSRGFLYQVATLSRDGYLLQFTDHITGQVVVRA